MVEKKLKDKLLSEVIEPIHERLDFFLQQYGIKKIPYFLGPEHLSDNASPNRFVWVPTAINLGAPRVTNALAAGENKAILVAWGKDYWIAANMAALINAAAADVKTNYAVRVEGEATFYNAEIPNEIKEGVALFTPIRWITHWKRLSEFDRSILITSFEEEIEVT